MRDRHQAWTLIPAIIASTNRITLGDRVPPGFPVRGPGQSPHQSPSDTEQDRTCNQWPIHVAPGRPEILRGKHRTPELVRQGVARTRHRKSTRHHEGERGIPAAENVEKAQHLRGLRHARDQGGRSPKQVRKRNLLVVAMGRASYSVTDDRNHDDRAGHEDERGDDRASREPGHAADTVPGRQPPPSRVPNPTRRPEATHQ